MVPSDDPPDGWASVMRREKAATLSLSPMDVERIVADAEARQEAEVRRLRAEVAELRGQLAAHDPQTEAKIDAERRAGE